MYGACASTAGAGHALLHPRSPYALRQALRPLADDQLSRGLRVVRMLPGILFNHESPRAAVSRS